MGGCRIYPKQLNLWTHEQFCEGQRSRKAKAEGLNERSVGPPSKWVTVRRRERQKKIHAIDLLQVFYYGYNHQAEIWCNHISAYRGVNSALRETRFFSLQLQTREIQKQGESRSQDLGFSTSHLFAVAPAWYFISAFKSQHLYLSH